MKKSLLFILLTVFLMGCGGDSKEKAVEDFAKKFGMMAKYGDVNGIKEVSSLKEDIKSASLDYNEANISIFPQGDDKYKISYGHGAYIIVCVGLHDAIEVIDSQGIFTTSEPSAAVPSVTEAAESTPVSEENAAVSKEPAPAKSAPDEATIKKFATTFKNNVVADKQWYFGNPDANNSGSTSINVKNNNNKTVDGSDYYITFKYEYDYAEDMYSENVKQNGKTIPSKGKAKFTYHYTDDCSPGTVKVHFKLTDKQIYDKYAN